MAFHFSVKTPAQRDLLEAALADLVRLDDEVGPDGQAVLLDLIARGRVPSDRTVERVQVASALLLALLRDARQQLACAGYRSADPVLDDAIERTGTWLDRFASRPDAYQRVAAHGLRRLLVGQRQLNRVQVALRAEIERLRTATPPPAAPPNPPTGRPARAERHAQIFAEINRLREVLGEGTTWDEAVAGYHRSYGTSYSVEQVRQWGKRSRRKTRRQLVGAGAGAWDDADDGEYGI